MLHDGREYRLFIGRKGNTQQIYQFAFNPVTNSYEYGVNGSIPTLDVTGAPPNSRLASFSMLHDGSAYRYYYQTK